MTSEAHLPVSISRRSVLAVAGASFVTGAAATNLTGPVASQASASIASTAPGDAPPDVDLMEEHGVLNRILLVYQEATRRIGTGNAVPIAEINESALIVHDFIEGFHEALEEGYIFPALKRSKGLGPTVDTLSVQHARGRNITQFLLRQPTAVTSSLNPTRIATALSAFVEMFAPHEAREDTVIFPAFRSMHSQEFLQELGATFADLQRKQFGRGAFGSYVDKVAAIEKSLGIYDLSQFTAAQVN